MDTSDTPDSGQDDHPKNLSPSVAVEILRFSFSEGKLRVSSEQHTLSNQTPDQLAHSISFLDDQDPASLCHSTSWRYEEATAQGPTVGPTLGPTVVLTYAALPSKKIGRPVEAAPVMASGDPLRPTPPGLHEHHVVAHAMRHLIDLSTSDPAILLAASQPSAELLWQRMREFVEAIEVCSSCSAHEHCHCQDHEHRHRGVADTVGVESPK